MHDLARLLPDGVARRADVVRAASSTSVERWTASGAVRQLLPGVLVLPDRVADWSCRARAAVLWSDGALSHVSALAAWGATDARPFPVHVTVPAGSNPRGAPGVTVHRTARRLPVHLVDGVRVTSLAPSLVDSWAAATTPAARSLPRQAVIESVRRRRVSVADLRAESAARPRHRGRAELTVLLDLVEGGCQSELEIWGVTQVLRLPGLAAPVQQVPVRLPSGWVALDAAYLAALVAVELDGAAFHGSREQREQDLRRDTALAALGWVVLRFSYARLTREPEACRREIEQVVRRRLAMLAAGPAAR